MAATTGPAFGGPVREAQGSAHQSRSTRPDQSCVLRQTSAVLPLCYARTSVVERRHADVAREFPLENCEQRDDEESVPLRCGGGARQVRTVPTTSQWRKEWDSTTKRRRAHLACSTGMSRGLEGRVGSNPGATGRRRSGVVVEQSGGRPGWANSQGVPGSRRPARAGGTPARWLERQAHRASVCTRGGCASRGIVIACRHRCPSRGDRTIRARTQSRASTTAFGRVVRFSAQAALRRFVSRGWLQCSRCLQPQTPRSHTADKRVCPPSSVTDGGSTMVETSDSSTSATRR